ncbi:MAG: hypothetical protein ABIH46_05550 [Chloroflexota bacterium]
MFDVALIAFTVVCLVTFLYVTRNYLTPNTEGTLMDSGLGDEEVV